MRGEKFGHLGLDRLGQQGTRSIAQHLGERIGERPWLKQLDDVSIGHGVSLLCWRSGGANTPRYAAFIPSGRHQLPPIAQPPAINATLAGGCSAKNAVIIRMTTSTD